MNKDLHIHQLMVASMFTTIGIPLIIYLIAFYPFGYFAILFSWASILIHTIALFVIRTHADEIVDSYTLPHDQLFQQTQRKYINSICRIIATLFTGTSLWWLSTAIFPSITPYFAIPYHWVILYFVPSSIIALFTANVNAYIAVVMAQHTRR
ncbi:MAG: hypothetical protein ACPG8W_14775 [Candidatus Promineifilaceae bacterium]